MIVHQFIGQSRAGRMPQDDHFGTFVSGRKSVRLPWMAPAVTSKPILDISAVNASARLGSPLPLTSYRIRRFCSGEASTRCIVPKLAGLWYGVWPAGVWSAACTGRLKDIFQAVACARRHRWESGRCQWPEAWLDTERLQGKLDVDNPSRSLDAGDGIPDRVKATSRPWCRRRKHRSESLRH